MEKKLLLEKYIKVAVRKALAEQEAKEKRATKSMYLIYRFPGLKKVMEDFRTAFRKKFNGNVQIYAPYAYDATMLMITAMQKAGSADPAKYLPVMAASKYQGVTGLIEFDGKGDVKNSALTLYTFRNKQRIQLAVVR